MAISFKHAKVSGKSDGGDSTLVQPSDWNADHTLNMATARIIGRTTGGTGAAQEITVGSGLSLAATALTIADAGVSTAKIADGAVTTAKIADAAVGTAEVADAAITLAKLATPVIIQGKHSFDVDVSSGGVLSGETTTFLQTYQPNGFATYQGVQLDPAAVEHWVIPLGVPPKSWDKGHIEVQIKWSPPDTGTGNVVFGAAIAKWPEAGLAASAFVAGYTDAVADAAGAHAHSHQVTAVIALSGIAAAYGDNLYLHIRRNATDAGDTYGSDVILRGAHVNYTINAADDS